MTTIRRIIIAGLRGWPPAVIVSLAALYGMFMGMWVESRKDRQ